MPVQKALDPRIGPRVVGLAPVRLHPVEVGELLEQPVRQRGETVLMERQFLE